MCNQEIRKTAKEKKVYLWMVAEKMNVSEMTLTRKLRHELPDAEKAKILAIIDEIAERRNEA